VRNCSSLRGLSGWTAVTLLALAPSGYARSIEELRDLSLDQLAQIQVTSVSKSAEPLSDAPAAIYVITHDDVIRSGATTLPEMLRLAALLDEPG
jgi:iron complex outermembrane receptor protein